MANYYTQTSFVSTWPSKAARDAVMKCWEDGMLSCDERTDFGTAFEADGDTDIWHYAEESLSPELLAEFLQEMLQKFNPDGTIEFEWSGHCERMVQEGFGGGIAHITAERYTALSTYELLQKLKENRL